MIVLVTGGASGLGEAITKKIAQNSKFKVYFTYANSVEKASQIEASYANTKGIKCDFKNRTEVSELVAKIAELNIDVLVNNAYTGDFLKSHSIKRHRTILQMPFFIISFPQLKLHNRLY